MWMRMMSSFLPTVFGRNISAEVVEDGSLGLCFSLWSYSLWVKSKLNLFFSHENFQKLKEPCSGPPLAYSWMSWRVKHGESKSLSWNLRTLTSFGPWDWARRNGLGRRWCRNQRRSLCWHPHLTLAPSYCARFISQTTKFCTLFCGALRVGSEKKWKQSVVSFHFKDLQHKSNSRNEAPL